MPRSRLCALALVPLLVAGAAACGGGDGGPPPAAVAERPAAAPAPALTREFVDSLPSCRDWLDTPPADRAAAAADMAEGDREAGGSLTPARILGGLDRECAKRPDDPSVFDAYALVFFANLAERVDPRGRSH